MKKTLTILAAVAVAVSAQAQELSNFRFGRKHIVSPEIQNACMGLGCLNIPERST